MINAINNAIKAMTPKTIKLISHNIYIFVPNIKQIG